MNLKMKTILTNGYVANLISAVIVLMVFAVRIILDPMYINPDLIHLGNEIFSIFLWPYFFIENHFIGFDADMNHIFHWFWTPLGVLLTILYLSIVGNLTYFLKAWLNHSK